MAKQSPVPKRPLTAKATTKSFQRDYELEAVAEQCTRFINGHGPRRPRDLLALIPEDTKSDYYGVGGAVAELEQEIAKILGKPAALFFLTGTMAQQATLRVHADRGQSRSVAFHPACHLETHEERGYQHLHDLFGVPVGPRNEPLSAAELARTKQPISALLIELPQRDLGGTLPDWEELNAQVTWARDKGAAVHLDGARIWEASPYYKGEHRKTIKDVCGLFDTVYVSFYKGLGAIAGSCVAGEQDVIDELSVWRIRHGGRAFMMWPYAAAAFTALRQRLPLMPKYHKHAVAIGKALQGADGIQVLPTPVQSPMMHLRARITDDGVRRRVADIAKDEKVMMFPRAFSSDGGGVKQFELSVGDATLEFTPAEAADLLARLLAPT
jgi:threonine aldolase